MECDGSTPLLTNSVQGLPCKTGLLGRAFLVVPEPTWSRTASSRRTPKSCSSF